MESRVDRGGTIRIGMGEVHSRTDTEGKRCVGWRGIPERLGTEIARCHEAKEEKQNLFHRVLRI